MEYGNASVNHLVWRKSENKYHKEEEITLDNPNVNISILGKEIQPGSMVLDVGCGEGKLAKILQDRKCSLYGIEIDEEAIRYAQEKKRYLDIYHFNIEYPQSDAIEYKRFQEKKLQFDYIVIADILEHTINPTQVLIEISQYLKPKGKILVSVPNINNADIILNLLRGRFNYMEAGILDNTHTKYFTKISFVEWIDEANGLFKDFWYDCQYLGGVYGLTEYMEKIKKEKPFLFQFMELNPEYSIIQNLFVLHKKDKKETGQYLDALLKEKRVDLGEILSEYLEHGIKEKFLTRMRGIKMLSNERSIMEEKVESAQRGWEECDKKLSDSFLQIQQLNKQAEKLLSDNLELKEEEKVLEKKIQEVYQGWKQADEQYQKAVSDHAKMQEKEKELEKKVQEVYQGWKKADERYQEAVADNLKLRERGKELEQKIQEVYEGWKKADEQYQKAVADHLKMQEKEKELEKKVEEVLEGWKKADEKYQEAAAENLKMQEKEKEWEKKVQEVYEGWKKADEKYQEAVADNLEIKNREKVLEEKVQEAYEGWKRADEKYQEEIAENLKQKEREQVLEKKIQETLEGWKKANEKYQEAMEGWREADQKYQELYMKE